MKIVTTSSKIFKRDSTGKVRVWYAEVGTDDTNWAWRANTGIQNGKIVTSEWKRVEQKNVGKANETSLEEQATLEVAANMKKKLERGYFASVEDIDKFEKTNPMLASTYDAKKLDFENKIYFTQPKLDGIRCIARKDGLWTRSGKEITSAPHVVASLSEFFMYNPEAILDGELYNHELKDDFNKITSLVRKAKPKPADVEESKRLVQYHVYDRIDTGSRVFGERFEELKLEIGFDSAVVLVDTKYVKTQQELDDYYAQYIGDGYEGQMVREDQAYQENKRSKYLIKRKEFITEEYNVTGISEGQGNWSGCIKRFHLIDSHGVEFDAGVRGTQEQMKALLESGKQPNWATLRYFELTPDGIPRFPVVIDYGYAKRED